MEYSKLKVAELKDLLKHRGIPSTGLGRKQQIIEALEVHDISNTGHDNGTASPEVREAEEVVEPSTQDEDAAEAQVQNDNANGDPANTGDPEQESEFDTKVELAGPPSQDDVANEFKDQLSPANSRRGSTSEQSISSDSRKRKRRSPTPPLSTQSVNKKLKAAQKPAVKLPEDVDMDEPQTKGADDTRSEPGDDKIDSAPLESTEQGKISDSREGSPPNHVSQVDKSEDLDHASDLLDEQSSLHDPTRALYIRDLVRPLQPHQLYEYLSSLITPAVSSQDNAVIETFHLDALRTHAFALFTSIAAAKRVRAAMHSRIWPDEPARKALWVDYVPEDQVQTWIDIERDSGDSRRDAKRWEVVYLDTEGNVSASLQEVQPVSGPQPVPPPQQQSNSTAGIGPAIPNAPTGPRNPRSFDSNLVPPQDSESERPQPNTASFDVLDERFRYTTTRPKLYFLPVSKDLVDKRLNELNSSTSHQWDEVRNLATAAAEGQLRRYTFEDGDRLVDGGPDIGSFGRQGPPGNRPRGGRPRGVGGQRRYW